MICFKRVAGGGIAIQKVRLNGLSRAIGKKETFSMCDGVRLFVKKGRHMIVCVRWVIFSPSRVAPQEIYPVPAKMQGQFFYTQKVPKIERRSCYDEK